MVLYPKYLYVLYNAFPIKVVLKCPIWKGLAILGEEYSTIMFFPFPYSDFPYSSFFAPNSSTTV